MKSHPEYRSPLAAALIDLYEMGSIVVPPELENELTSALREMDDVEITPAAGGELVRFTLRTMNAERPQ